MRGKKKQNNADIKNDNNNASLCDPIKTSTVELTSNSSSINVKIDPDELTAAACMETPPNVASPPPAHNVSSTTEKIYANLESAATMHAGTLSMTSPQSPPPPVTVQTLEVINNCIVCIGSVGLISFSETRLLN